MPSYLAIKGFRTFQHYHKRGAPWIKLYAALLSDAEFMQLPEAAQAQLMKLWLLASQMGHPLPNTPRLLAGKIGSTGKFYLEALIEVGFLIPCDDSASDVLAEPADNASTMLARDDGFASTVLARDDEFASTVLAKPVQDASTTRAGTRGRERVERGEERERTTPSPPSRAIRFAAAANRGLSEHPTCPQSIPRILWSQGATVEACEAWTDIPDDFVEAVLYELARTHRATDGVASLKYFVAAVRKRWRQRQAAGDAANASPAVLPAAPSWGERNDATIMQWLRDHGEA